MSKDFENNDKNREPNNFGLPDGYFNKSAGSIMNKIEWIEEHKEFKNLSELKKACLAGRQESGFIVPGNYFEQSESKLELIEYPHLLKQTKDAGFVVPEYYFDELEANELGKILVFNENELEPFSVLNSVQKLNPFTVEENYFTNSEQKIITALTANKQARVINLFSAKKLYMAAAAVLMITLSLWIYNQYFKIAPEKDCGTLACVDKADLVKAKNKYLDEDEFYKTVDAKKLEEKLKDKENNKENSDSTKKLSAEELLDEI